MSFVGGWRAIGDIYSRFMNFANTPAITSGVEESTIPIVGEPASQSSLMIQREGAPTPSTMMVRATNGDHELRSVNAGMVLSELYTRAVLNPRLNYAAYFFKPSGMRQTEEMQHSSILQLGGRKSVSMGNSFVGVMFKQFLEDLKPQLTKMLAESSAYDRTDGSMNNCIRPNGVVMLSVATKFTEIGMLFPGSEGEDVSFTMKSSNPQAEYIQEMLSVVKPGSRDVARVNDLIDALELAGLMHLSAHVDRTSISKSLKLTRPALQALSVRCNYLETLEKTAVQSLLKTIIDNNEGFKETYDRMKNDVFLSSFIVMCLFLINPMCLGSRSMDIFAMLRDEIGPIASHFIVCSEAREEFRNVFGVELLPVQNIFDVGNKEKTVKARLFYVLACLTIHCNESINENIFLSSEQLSQLLFSLASTMVTHEPAKSVRAHQKEADKFASKAADVLGRNGVAGESHALAICDTEAKISAQIQAVLNDGKTKGRKGKNHNYVVYDYGPTSTFVDNFVRLFPKMPGCKGHDDGAGVKFCQNWLELNEDREADVGINVFSRDANSFNGNGFDAKFRDAEENFPMVIVNHFIRKLNDGDYPVNSVACLITGAMKEVSKNVDFVEETRMYTVKSALEAGLQNMPRVQFLGNSSYTPDGASSSSQRGQSSGGADRVELRPVVDESSSSADITPPEDPDVDASVTEEPLSASARGKRRATRRGRGGEKRGRNA